MPTASTVHDLLQVLNDLLTGRAWLVPTSKSAAAETAARNYIASVSRDVNVFVAGRDIRFTSAF